MRLKKERVAALARTLVERLIEQHLIRAVGAPAGLVATVDRIITDELLLEDRVDAEVRKILESYRSQIDQGQVDERKVFLMIKKQLAKERGIIL
jgi:hypothetical protein